MARAEKRNSKEFEDRLKELKKEQRRLAREISAISRGSIKSTPASGPGRRKTTVKPSRKPAAESRSGRPNETVEMKAYFSNGSFRGKRKLRRERSVQRNKAIFMLVVSLVAVYIFFTWVF